AQAGAAAPGPGSSGPRGRSPAPGARRPNADSPDAPAPSGHRAHRTGLRARVRRERLADRAARRPVVSERPHGVQPLAQLPALALGLAPAPRALRDLRVRALAAGVEQVLDLPAQPPPFRLQREIDPVALGEQLLDAGPGVRLGIALGLLDDRAELAQDRAQHLRAGIGPVTPPADQRRAGPREHEGERQ